MAHTSTSATPRVRDDGKALSTQVQKFTAGGWRTAVIEVDVALNSHTVTPVRSGGPTSAPVAPLVAPN